MKNLCFLVLSVLLAFQQSNAQNLISTTFLGSRTKTTLINQFGIPLIQYGVKFYRITYTTPDVKGVLDTVSGLVVIPNAANLVYPRLVYQHGTSGSRNDVPSINVVQPGGEGSIGLLCGGLGYVALLPDYLGLGSGRGFHPYVHAASEASAALDMLRALDQFAAAQQVTLNDQLFITGYSQGGHAAMALHREIETNLSTEFTVTASAPLSGPYSISGVMRDLVLSQATYLYPAYLPNTILSYQTVYGNLFDTIPEVFKAPYAAPIQQFYNGQLDLTDLNLQLIDLLTTNVGASKPVNMFQDSVIASISTNPNHPFNIALADNDVYKWAPQAPTRLFYCMADDQVPFMNSVVARDTMTALGAVNFAASDVMPTADHGGCFNPAFTQTLLFFAGFQQITTGLSEKNGKPLQLLVSPNPTAAICRVQQIPADGQVLVLDANGRSLFETAAKEGQTVEIDVARFPNGTYIVLFAGFGQIARQSLVVHH